MRLTQFTDFALRVLLHAAVQPDRWLTVAETARCFGGLSEDHVAKVVRGLGKAGWLTVRRGRGGGFQLAKSPEEVVVGQVVRATEPDFHIVECFDPGKRDCPILPACGLTNTLNRAREAFLAVLDEVTLADVIGSQRDLLAGLLDASPPSGTSV